MEDATNKLSGDKKLKARDSKGRDSAAAEDGPLNEKLEGRYDSRLKKAESMVQTKAVPRRLNLDELEDQNNTERSEGMARRDAHASQEKKPSLLQQAFPALLSPKGLAEPKV